MAFEEDAPVTPDGTAIRRMRRGRGWSRRALLEAIARASLRESGVRESLTPNLLEHVEEVNERVPYGTLCRIASGLDCDPMDLVLE